MVTYEPETLEPNNPPIIAVIKPARGGNPDAIAIPRHNGRAIKETLNPETISSLKCAFNPEKPVSGIDPFVIVSFWLVESSNSQSA
jgi:hypothetical protein